MRYISINITMGNRSFKRWLFCGEMLKTLEYERIAATDAQTTDTISSIVANQIGILTNTMIAANGISGENEYPSKAIWIISVDLHHTLVTKWLITAATAQITYTQGTSRTLPNHNIRLNKLTTAQGPKKSILRFSECNPVLCRGCFLLGIPVSWKHGPKYIHKILLR